VSIKDEMESLNESDLEMVNPANHLLASSLQTISLNPSLEI